jgi:hypothetical protein
MGGEPTAKRKAQKGLTMNTNEMTMRKYHEAVLAIPGCPADVAEKAKAEIAKLDATNVKRTEKAKAKQVEYEPLKTAIYHFLLVNGMKTTAEIAAGVEVLGGSSPKASAMCRQMVEEGRLTSHEVKVKGKGAQKAYTAIRSDEMGEDDPVQATDYELNTMH